jgi:hypothetical protein
MKGVIGLGRVEASGLWENGAINFEHRTRLERGLHLAMMATAPSSGFFAFKDLANDSVHCIYTI